MNLKFKNLWVTLGVIQIILSFYFCLRPVPPVAPKIEHLDKLLHFSAYALLGAYQLSFFRLKKFPAVFIFLMAQGILIEILQFFTGYRSFEWSDMLANGLGVLYSYYFLKGFDLDLLNGIEKMALKNQMNLS